MDGAMLFKSEGSVDRACFLGQRMLLTRLYSEFLEQLITVFFVFGGFFQVSDPVSEVLHKSLHHTQTILLFLSFFCS